jgi:hypothetical protein
VVSMWHVAIGAHLVGSVEEDLGRAYLLIVSTWHNVNA